MLSSQYPTISSAPPTPFLHAPLPYHLPSDLCLLLSLSLSASLTSGPPPAPSSPSCPAQTTSPPGFHRQKACSCQHVLLKRHNTFPAAAAFNTALEPGSFAKSSKTFNIFSRVSRVNLSTSAAVRSLVGMGERTIPPPILFHVSAFPFLSLSLPPAPHPRGASASMWILFSGEKEKKGQIFFRG